MSDFLVRSYLGSSNCVEIDRVRGNWNLEAFRQIPFAETPEFYVVALWTFQIAA